MWVLREFFKSNDQNQTKLWWANYSNCNPSFQFISEAVADLYKTKDGIKEFLFIHIWIRIMAYLKGLGADADAFNHT